MTPRKIRLAFVLPHLRMGGVETVVCNLICNLDRCSFEPMLVLKQHDGELLAKLPADCLVVQLGQRHATGVVPALRRFLLRYRPDAVYSATSAINLACLAAVRSLPRRARPLTIVGEHTLPVAYLGQAKRPFLRRAMTRLLYPTADAIAVPTHAIGVELRLLLANTCPPIHVLPNPVLPAGAIEMRLETEAGSMPSAATVRFVGAGRLVEAKGFDVLIAAFALAAGSLPSNRLTIYGDGPQRQALLMLAQDLGVGERVFLPGNVDDLVGQLAAHDIFVLSSRREGFGNVVVEAMAAGLPVIATDQAGPRALLDDGRAGFFVPSGAAEPLARAMIELAGRDDLRRDFAAAGRLRCGDFTIEAATRRFERLVGTLCNARFDASRGQAGAPMAQTVTTEAGTRRRAGGHYEHGR